MIREANVCSYCKDNLSKIENYEKAINDTTQTWHCHHRAEIEVLPSGIVVRRSKSELIKNDRYYHRPANELIFLTRSEHMRLHNKDRQVNADTVAKLKLPRNVSYKMVVTYDGDMCLKIPSSLRAEIQAWYESNPRKCRKELTAMLNDKFCNGIDANGIRRNFNSIFRSLKSRRVKPADDFTNVKNNIQHLLDTYPSIQENFAM